MKRNCINKASGQVSSQSTGAVYNLCFVMHEEKEKKKKDMA